MRTLLAVILVCMAGALAPGQDKKKEDKEVTEFKKRTKVLAGNEKGKRLVQAYVDDTLVYEGFGRDGSVDLVKSEKLEGVRFVTVSVDGKEILRLQVSTLKPLKVPRSDLGSAKNLGFTTTGSLNNGKACIRVTLKEFGKRGQAGEIVPYDGPGASATPKVVSGDSRDEYTITVDGEVVYRAPVAHKTERSKGDGQDVRQNPMELHTRELILVRLNEHRRGAGLASVTEDPELTKGCQSHAEYLAKNDGRKEIREGGAHREEKELEGYSDSGAKSAARSVVGWFSARNGTEPEGLMATLYHRIQLLDPRLMKVGIGVAEIKDGRGVVVIDVTKLGSFVEAKAIPILYPYPEQTNVPLEFGLGCGEWPNPIPDKQAKAGYPITVTCPELTWNPGDAEAILQDDGEEVSCWISTPDKPARTDSSQTGTLCVLPKKPLKAGTKYTITVKCKQFGVEKTPGWEKTWWFTTAEAKK